MHTIGLMPPRFGVNAVDQDPSACGMTAGKHGLQSLMQIRLRGTARPTRFTPLKELDACRESLIESV
jgi:hypothetical protein